MQPNIQKLVQLKNFSTMRLGGTAKYLAYANNTNKLIELITWAKKENIKSVIIGTGSNIIWSDDGFDGLVIVNQIKSYNAAQNSTDNSAIFTFGAGENWDEMVKNTVELGYSGLEQLSLIPGTCGAAPVQNIGAYGKELKDTLVQVEAYDKQTNKLIKISNKDCDFAYRSSIFKTTHKNRYAITSISVRLTKTNPKPPFYESLNSYLKEHSIINPTPSDVRKAVIAIRNSKLPDPKVIANNGSFFANPIIEVVVFEELASKYPQIPHWKIGNNKVKLASGWLVEQAGFAKGYQDKETGMSLWKDQALVFVNDSAKSTSNLIKFKNKITLAVQKKFGILLEQEPELI